MPEDKDLQTILMLGIGLLAGTFVCKTFSETVSYAAKKSNKTPTDTAAKPADTAAPAPAKGAKTPAAAPSGGGGGAATPAGSSTGGGTGKLPYATSGKTWKMSDSGKTKRNYASGGSSGTTEWNAEVGGVANLMGVVYYTHPASCGGGHGDEADIKMYGPHHSDGGCCWCIVNINGAGQVCTGGEGPHPKTDKCRKTVGNVGSVAGKRVGLCHVIRAGPVGEVWIDTGGGFKKVGGYSEQCGSAKKSSTPSSGQQVQFRCDCAGVKVESATVYEISASGGGGGGPAPSGAGAVVPALRPGATGGSSKKAAAAFARAYGITIA